MKTLAIFSPNQNAFSETFIHAHKNLPYNVKYYYGDWIPSILENEGSLLRFSIAGRIKKRFNRNFSLSEHALIQSLGINRVDCILAEYGPTAAATLKVAEFLKIPMIVHFHGFDASETKIIEEYSVRYQDVFKYASYIIAVSQSMKASLVAMGCPVKKIVVSIYGPNPIFFTNRPDYKNLQFLAVGRFVDKKAPYLTILSFHQVLKDHPNCSLVMVGDGELFNTCSNITRSLQITDKVIFRGVLSSMEIQQEMEKSLAFVQHSLVADNGDSEGTPVAILEAQAAALPVISTYHAGIPEVVEHRVTGFLVNETDISEMTRYMKLIAGNKELARRMGNAARSRIAEHFTIHHHLDKLKEVIDETILAS